MDFRAIIMGLFFALMWSSAFATARIIVADAPPLLSLSLRFALTGIIAVGLARILGQSWRLEGGWRGMQARAVFVFGLCQNALYLGLNFVAMQWVEASLAAIIASSMPLIVALLGWAFLGQVASRRTLIGLAIGFSGVALIMGTRVQGGADALGIVLCILGALALAVATLTVKGASGSGNLLMIVGLQMLVGAAILALASVLTEVPLINVSLPWIAAFLYQCFVPGLTATLVWFSLVRRIGAVKAATFHFLNPAFGVAIAAALLGERVTAPDLVGVVIAMAGILIVQMERSRS